VKLKFAQLPLARNKLMAQQDYCCALCGKSFKGRGAKKPALDHCHIKGTIRDVLCLNCNRREGEIWNRVRTCDKDAPIEWLAKLVEYWRRHSAPKHGGIIHPSHKSETEKRLAKNAKARAKRAAIKKG